MNASFQNPNGQPAQASTNNSVVASWAWVDGDWQRSVRLAWDDQGMLTEVTPEWSGVAPLCGPVIPGMPNLHSHAFQSAMAGLTEYRANPDDSFWSWRDLMYRFAARINPDMMAAIARYLYIDMLKAGYTSVCEFHYIHHQPHGGHYADAPELMLQVTHAARQAGIGMTMLPVLYQYSDFGARPPRSDQARFINTPDQLLQLLAEARGRIPESSMLRYGVAPHSLRAVTTQSLRELLDGLDRDFPDCPVHIHIAEQTAEVDACLAEHGARPVQWLLDSLPVDERWCLVHATHMDDVETGALARTGAVAGLCPTTEANLGDGVFPARAWLDAGGRLGIGSDSHISIDWRSELRLLEYSQRLTSRQRNILAGPQENRIADFLFQKALDGGSQAAGRPIQGLRAGQQADFVVLDGDHPHIASRPHEMWMSCLVFSERGPSPIRDVYVGGQAVVRDGRHEDEDIAWSAYQATMEKLLASGQA